MMRVLGSLLLAIIVGVLALVLLVKLFIGALKLVGVLIAIGLAVIVYLVAEKLIGVGR